MAGLPVTIRLLDPPLHEFLPHSAEELADVAAAAGISPETARQRSLKLSESNPMLGHRGCRLAVTYPEICRMQARAIFEAATAIAASGTEAPVPEIMIPLAATAKELELCKAVIDAEARAVAEESGRAIDYLVGTMVELPRASVCADQLAAQAEFFSFGTNDLTQTALGISAMTPGPSCTPTPTPRSTAPTRSSRSMSKASARLCGWGRAGRDAGRPEARRLRRAWRRPGFHRLLRAGRARLRLPVRPTGAGRAAGGGAGDNPRPRLGRGRISGKQKGRFDRPFSCVPPSAGASVASAYWMPRFEKRLLKRAT